MPSNFRVAMIQGVRSSWTREEPHHRRYTWQRKILIVQSSEVIELWRRYFGVTRTPRKLSFQMVTT